MPISQMENFGESSTKVDDQIDLPPGFRFHPTDEELITHYLSNKVLDSRFTALAIGEADLNKSEPWDLPWKAKMGEKQWYFFCLRDRKYPTGLRTNRATVAGYWKATGKDKEIYRAKTLVGMKKTLVFYQGRAPKGVKTNWVMHEYRLEGKYSLFNHPKSSKNEWVISRVFEKGSSGNKRSNYVSDLVNDHLGSSLLPPLMDSMEKTRGTSSIKSELTPHVTCFSNTMEVVEEQQKMIDCFPNPFYLNHQSFPSLSNFQYPLFQDQTILKDLLMENNETILKMGMSCKAEMEAVISISQETGLTTDMNIEISSVLSNHEMGIHSFEEQEVPSTSTGPVDLDCLWNY